ncbi:collagen alpha-2(i) chain-like [Plakobranchus ocellatus]|uniref:Collagen alpha-2(I) chain-like n=1 Tax=Plakobranchus ocellatus TaxID=259542 RepID=A0AAV4AIY1_9GAST|nr:collagen alpha-2(i) chain-like [Plakobranchus ocellatus]
MSGEGERPLPPSYDEATKVPTAPPAFETDPVQTAAGAQPPYPNQPSFPTGQPPHPSGQPPYPSGQPSYPSGQPPYPSGQPSYPSGQPPYPSCQPPYSSGQPSYPGAQPAYQSGQPGYPPQPQQQSYGPGLTVGGTSYQGNPTAAQGYTYPGQAPYPYGPAPGQTQYTAGPGQPTHYTHNVVTAGPGYQTTPLAYGTTYTAMENRRKKGMVIGCILFIVFVVIVIIIFSSFTS